MRGDRGELLQLTVAALEPLGKCLEPLFACPLRFFGLFAIRQVAGDFQESLEVPRCTLPRRHHNISPEPGAVLADSPALVLEPALLLGHIQLMLRPAFFDHLRWIETGEILANDLRGRIALDAFGSGVPTENVSLGVEQ